GLPKTGSFLDFGCGTGVFTEVLADALPGWTAFGTDIVETALVKARSRVPSATFAPLDDLSGRFDLIFSHHVLEHVMDIRETAARIGRLCAPNGVALNILPCGNPGSFESDICAAVRDGVDPERSNRFYFEDESHLRRLTSDQLVEILDAAGLAPKDVLFANH